MPSLFSSALSSGGLHPLGCVSIIGAQLILERNYLTCRKIKVCLRGGNGGALLQETPLAANYRLQCSRCVNEGCLCQGGGRGFGVGVRSPTMSLLMLAGRFLVSRWLLFCVELTQSPSASLSLIKRSMNLI